jgi:DNA-binding MarR family transcriptional regulator
MKDSFPELPIALQVSRGNIADMPLGRLVVLASKHIATHFQRAIATEGIASTTGWVLLGGLAVDDGVSLSEVATACGVSPATATGVVDTLEREGLVTRVRDDVDRRVVRIAITPEGRRRVEAARRAVIREIGPRMPELSVDEEAVVRKFLYTTIDRMSATGTTPERTS